MGPPRSLTSCGRCPPGGPQPALGRPGAGLSPHGRALRVTPCPPRGPQPAFGRPGGGLTSSLQGVPDRVGIRFGFCRVRVQARDAGAVLLPSPSPSAGPGFQACTFAEKKKGPGGPSFLRCCGCHCTSRTTRLFRGWVGRALLGNSLENRRSCSELRVTGVFSTSHSTPSVQGGVVREPRNW